MTTVARQVTILSLPGRKPGEILRLWVRNSFGLAFDPITGELWDTENGPNSYDEIKFYRASTPVGNKLWDQIHMQGHQKPYYS